MELKDRRVVVTGAASGIGMALTREFLRRGAKVLAVDVNASSLEQFAKDDRIQTLTADVGDKANYHAVLETAFSGVGAPLVFVNCAGIARAGAFLDADLKATEDTLRINLNGLIYGTYFALKKMSAAGEGTIVNIASMAGHVPTPYLSAYAASKYAVVGFTRSLRAELELAGSPVRLTLVSPGFVQTPIMKQPGFEVPDNMAFMVDKPESVARRIVDGIVAEKDEIFPTAGGGLLKTFYDWAPALYVPAARLLVNLAKKKK